MCQSSSFSDLGRGLQLASTSSTFTGNSFTKVDYKKVTGMDDVSKQIKATKDISTENFHGGDNSDDEDLLLLFLNSDEDNETKKSSIKNEESDKFKDFIREYRNTMEKREREKKEAKSIIDDLIQKAGGMDALSKYCSKLFESNDITKFAEPSTIPPDLLGSKNNYETSFATASSIVSTSNHYGTPYSPSCSIITTTTESNQSDLQNKSVKDKRCPFCLQNFASVQSKTRHISRIHKDHVDKIIPNVYVECDLPFFCATCKKGFSSIAALRIHERRHNEDAKQFVCSICGRGYVYNSELRKHVKRTHEKQKFNQISPSAVEVFENLSLNKFQDMPNI